MKLYECGRFGTKYTLKYEVLSYSACLETHNKNNFVISEIEQSSMLNNEAKPYLKGKINCSQGNEINNDIVHSPATLLSQNTAEKNCILMQNAFMRAFCGDRVEQKFVQLKKG